MSNIPHILKKHMGNWLGLILCVYMRNNMNIQK